MLLALVSQVLRFSVYTTSFVENQEVLTLSTLQHTSGLLKSLVKRSSESPVGSSFHQGLAVFSVVAQSLSAAPSLNLTVV